MEEARRVWQQALAATHSAVDASGESSVLFNGGFEHDLIDGGFDWRETPVPGASVYIHTGGAHSRPRFVKIKLGGTVNLDFPHLFPWVAVQPPRPYLLAAFLLT